MNTNIVPPTGGKVAGIGPLPLGTVSVKDVAYDCPVERNMKNERDSINTIHEITEPNFMKKQVKAPRTLIIALAKYRHDIFESPAILVRRPSLRNVSQ
jgi:hypothetical protein